MHHSLHVCKILVLNEGLYQYLQGNTLSTHTNDCISFDLSIQVYIQDLILDTFQLFIHYILVNTTEYRLNRGKN